MKKQLLLIAVLLAAGVCTTADLLACGEKFLMVSRGTRYQRAALARNAAILVYANPASSVPKALGNTPIDLTLSKAGYRPTLVTGADELDKALRQGGWDLVVADLSDIPALRSRLQGSSAPTVLPVAYNATNSDLAQAKKDYQRVIKAPLKSQALLEAVDEALALRQRARAKSAATV